MDDEDDAKYPPNGYGMNRQKFTAENVGYPRNGESSFVEEDSYDDDEEDIENEEEGDDDNVGNNSDDDDDKDDDDDDDGNGVQRIGKEDYGDYDEDNDDDDDDEYGGLQRQPKKKKLRTLLSSYEFAPRVPTPPSIPKPSYGGRNPLTDWTEHETFVLLDAWGERFLKQGRKSLRSEEWQEVSEKVSHESKIERTDTQCRNRLDTLKKKYKKEKMKLGEPGRSTSEWVYFKKMDTLLSPLPQQSGLSCGIDSGEYIFMNPKVYLNRSNGLDEMRDSPGNSESGGVEEDESEGLPPQKARNCSLKLLADSIRKFSDVYEKIEKSKRQQMQELEQMRMDFHRDLESQKRQILERGRAEIARIRQGDAEDNDVSAENVSG